MSELAIIEIRIRAGALDIAKSGTGWGIYKVDHPEFRLKSTKMKFSGYHCGESSKYECLIRALDHTESMLLNAKNSKLIILVKSTGVARMINGRRLSGNPRMRRLQEETYRWLDRFGASEVLYFRVKL